MGALRDEWTKFKSSYPEWVKLRKSDMNLGKTLDEIDKLFQSIASQLDEQAAKLNKLGDELAMNGAAGHKKLLEILLAYRQVITGSTLANKEAAAKALDAFRDKASRFSAWPGVAAKHVKDAAAKLKTK